MTTEKDFCPTCGTEVELQAKDPRDPKDLEIQRLSALVLNLKSELATLKTEVNIQRRAGIQGELC